MVRILDVAKHAGLSVASVSRVLAGLPGVSEATRQRVMVRVLDALGDEDPERALGALGREIRARRAS